MQENISSLVTEVSTAETDSADAQGRNELLERELSDMTLARDSLTDERNQLKLAMGDAEKESNAKLAELQASIDKLNLQNETVVSESEGIAAELDEMKISVERLTAQRDLVSQCSAK